jgi:hypothetical protein
MPYRVPVASLAVARDTEVRSLCFRIVGNYRVAVVVIVVQSVVVSDRTAFIGG